MGYINGNKNLLSIHNIFSTQSVFVFQSSRDPWIFLVNDVHPSVESLALPDCVAATGTSILKYAHDLHGSLGLYVGDHTRYLALYLDIHHRLFVCPVTRRVSRHRRAMNA